MNTGKSAARVVVVGGGFAGIEVVKTLQEWKVPVQVTLVSKSSIFEYYPALYRLVTGALPIEVSVPLRTIFPDPSIDIREATYTGFDQAKQVITVTNLDGGTESIAYDYLVLALGSETNYFNIPGLPENSYSFKSVKEALRLKQHFCELMMKAKSATKDEAVMALHTIIVGGGPSGVELAGDLKHYLVRLAKEVGVDPTFITIDVLESNGRILPMLSEKVSTIAEMRLRKMGVNIFTNRALQSQEIADIVMSGMEMQAGTVVWTAGTRINSGYINPSLPLDAKKRIAVTDTLTLPNDNHVFIAGDGAGTQWSGLAQTAIHNGEYIGQAIKTMIKGRIPKAYKPHQPSFVIPVGESWSIFTHKNFVMTGWIPWIMRNAIDFMYFTSIVPMRYVLGVFQKGKKYRKSSGGCPIEQL